MGSTEGDSVCFRYYWSALGQTAMIQDGFHLSTNKVAELEEAIAAHAAEAQTHTPSPAQEVEAA